MPITRQTAATIYFQNLPTSPNILPIKPDTNPNTVKVMDNPKMNNKEKISDFFILAASLYPATMLIINGIMARTQGLEAVINPPMKTATTASYGLC